MLHLIGNMERPSFYYLQYFQHHGPCVLGFLAKKCMDVTRGSKSSTYDSAGNLHTWKRATTTPWSCCLEQAWLKRGSQNIPQRLSIDSLGQSDIQMMACLPSLAVHQIRHVLGVSVHNLRAEQSHQWLNTKQNRVSNQSCAGKAWCVNAVAAWFGQWEFGEKSAHS